MENSSRPSFRCGGGGDRRLDIVSGRGYNYSSSYNNKYNNQIMVYNNMPTTSTCCPRTPELQPVPASVTRTSDANTKPWGFSDPEMKRRKRIARYKSYGVEGRVKASIRSGLRWIKNKCSEIIHGY